MSFDIDAEEATSRGGPWVAILAVEIACFATGYSVGYFRGFDAAATRTQEKREALIRLLSPRPGHAERVLITEP